MESLLVFSGSLPRSSFNWTDGDEGPKLKHHSCFSILIGAFWPPLFEGQFFARGQNGGSALRVLHLIFAFLARMSSQNRALHWGKKIKDAAAALGIDKQLISPETRFHRRHLYPSWEPNWPHFLSSFKGLGLKKNSRPASFSIPFTNPLSHWNNKSRGFLLPKQSSVHFNSHSKLFLSFFCSTLKHGSGGQQTTTGGKKKKGLGRGRRGSKFQIYETNTRTTTKSIWEEGEEDKNANERIGLWTPLKHTHTLKGFFLA